MKGINRLEQREGIRKEPKKRKVGRILLGIVGVLAPGPCGISAWIPTGRI